MWTYQRSRTGPWVVFYETHAGGRMTDSLHATEAAANARAAELNGLRPADDLEGELNVIRADLARIGAALAALQDEVRNPLGRKIPR